MKRKIAPFHRWWRPDMPSDILVTEACAAWMSVPMGLDSGNSALEFTQNDRISRRGMSGFIGQLQDLGRRIAGGQAFQTPGGIFPIGIAACSAQQVNLPLRTLQKGRTQFCYKRLVVPHSSRQSGIQSPIIK